MFVKSKPCVLDRNLLSMQASCVPILRVLDYSIEVDVIWCKALGDQGIGGKINTRAIELVEHHSLEVPP
jgi:hypothetical protein